MMVKNWWLLWVALSSLSLTSHALAEEGTEAFAIVIGNNRSVSGHRPDLHYADDDAAKYFEILQSIAPEHVTLLTEADADTARLFPDTLARAVPPTKRALLEAGAELASAIGAAQRSGRSTELYFVFAGHGDVDEGSGFIELADARFTAAELEHWLRAIPFTHAHVILDSCNSFFMLGARKPGGRYYATSDDAVRALSARLPNVGVFLSTSADGDAFEWSEIQSGVFSHLVRSGLVGAADANADGRVDYLELAAFVATATGDVINPNMRPHVFARGPGGHDELPIVSRTRSGVRTLQFHESDALRLRLRDPNGIPLLDAHTEAQNAYLLQLPERWALGALLERGPRAGQGSEPERLTLPAAPEHLTLASLEPAAARGSAPRGPAEIFEALFKSPFGMRALVRYQQQLTAAKPAVYGVSRENAERMGLLLDQIAAAEHGERRAAAVGSFGLAGFYGLYGGSMFAFDHRFSSLSRGAADTIGAISLGLSAGALATGIYRLLSVGNAEQLALDYRAALAVDGGDYARAFAVANDRLRSVASAERRQRWLEGISGGLLIAGSGVALTLTELERHTPDARVNARELAGLGLLLGTVELCRALLIESPIQRLLRVWDSDSRHLQLQPVVAPLAGGAYLGAQGTF